MNKITLTALAAAAGFFSTTAMAQYEGQFLIQGGVTRIEPKVKSGDLSPPAPSGTKIDNAPSTKPSAGIGLMLTDSLSAFVPLAPPFKFDIFGRGAIAGVGKVGSVQSLPATQFFQYRLFDAEATFRPYVGLGVTYAYFFKPESSAALTSLTNPGGPATLFKVKSKFAPTVQVGFTYLLSDPYYLDVWYAKTFLKTKVTLSTGQTQDVEVNPSILQIAVGTSF